MPISPELQDIINQVKRYATSSISPTGQQTAAQGRALLGIGDTVAGIQRTDTGEIGATERQAAGIASTEGMAAKKNELDKNLLDLKKTELLGIGGIGVPKESLISTQPKIGGSSPNNTSLDLKDIWDRLGKL